MDLLLPKRIIEGVIALDVSSAQILLSIFSLSIAGFLWWLLFTPLNRVRNLTDVGFDYLEDESQRRGKKLKTIINEVRARRKIGELPPVYPNGWFALLESDQLSVGQVKPVQALGENFVVFRTEDGAARVLDAYCPHLGAHLGIGGRVMGNCIECPFHGWQFDGNTGNCTAVPYADKVPAFAKVKKWHSFECTGYIFVWYHAEGLEPTWDLPLITEISNGEWVYRGRAEHYVNSYVEDISENGGDLAHLPQIHSSPFMAGVDLRWMRNKLWSFAEHTWDGSWQQCEAPNGHVGVLSMKHALSLFGKLDVMNMDIHATQIGPGLVYLRLNTTFGDCYLIQTVTPVEPLLMKIVHRIYCQTSMLHPLSKLIIWGECIMLERDVMVWNNKTYAFKPLLVKEDKFLGKHRRWFSQFFSENSPRLNFTKETLEW